MVCNQNQEKIMSYKFSWSLYDEEDDDADKNDNENDEVVINSGTLIYSHLPLELLFDEFHHIIFCKTSHTFQNENIKKV